MKTAILTSALNEEKALQYLFKCMRSEYDVFVVDDGSSDLTRMVSEQNGAKVISHLFNLGQGYAFITGMKCIMKNHGDLYDYIVYLDADGQHNPSEIPKFIHKAEEEDVDVVVGSRIKGSNYANAPFFRRTFLPFCTAIINKLTGYRMTDSMCGFRVFRVSTTKRIIALFDDMLEPEYLASEMFLRFSKAGLKVAEVPINLSDRMEGSSYKGFLRYGLGVVRAILRTLLDKNYRAKKTVYDSLPMGSKTSTLG